MNRSDKWLIGILIMSSLLMMLTLFFVPKKEGTFAVVTYRNKEVMTIDLKKDATYQVTAKNGDVTLVVKDESIKVASENSPYHLCQKQGTIQSSNEVLACLPNELIVTITGSKQIDTMVK